MNLPSSTRQAGVSTSTPAFGPKRSSRRADSSPERPRCQSTGSSDIQISEWLQSGFGRRARRPTAQAHPGASLGSRAPGTLVAETQRCREGRWAPESQVRELRCLTHQRFANHSRTRPRPLTKSKIVPAHCRCDQRQRAGRKIMPMSGEAILENVRRYRAIASLHRQTAAFRLLQRCSLPGASRGMGASCGQRT